MAIRQQNGLSTDGIDLSLVLPENPPGGGGPEGGGPEGPTDTPENKYAVGPSTTIDTTKTPSSMTDLNSELGHGLEAAEGTNYSWDKKAAERANLAYQSDVLTAKQNYLQQRQNIEQQGQQMQTQYDMAQYSNNQSSEKVGWTGGYALDEKRQMDYLKSTIQSQMYGSMELQKYGYDTSLAAARLAYDTNKYDLALEYYNTALSRAVTAAELTGVYISPEAEEMRGQFFAAEEKLKENPNDENAKRVKDATRQWFESNGISENGVYTLNALMELNVLYETMWDKIESTYKDTDLYRLDSDTFLNVNATPQQIALNGEAAYRINFKTMEPKDVIEYIDSDPSGRAKEQYLSYLDYQGDTISESIVDDLYKEGIINKVTAEDGTVTYTTDLDDEALRDTIINSMAEKSDTLIDTIQKELSRFSAEEKKQMLKYYLNYEYEMKLPGELPDIMISINPVTGNTSLSEDIKKNRKNNKDITEYKSSQEMFNDLDKIFTPTDTFNINDMYENYASLDDAIIFQAETKRLKKYNEELNIKEAELVHAIGGENNIKNIEDIVEKYEDMSDEDIAGLSDTAKLKYENAKKWVETYNNVKKLNNLTDDFLEASNSSISALRRSDVLIEEVWDRSDGGITDTIGAAGATIIIGLAGVVGQAMETTVDSFFRPIKRVKKIGKGIKKIGKKIKKLFK
jgi:hypothetical protein